MRRPHMRSSAAPRRTRPPTFQRTMRPRCCESCASRKPMTPICPIRPRATTAAPEPGHSASLRAFTPVFDGLRTRVNALMESTAADAADDAAPGPRVKPGGAQDPGERTEGADRQQEPAPIEPPRSWTKEDKELFTSLPRATQERIAERERSRQE